MLYNDREREVMKDAMYPPLRGKTLPDGVDLPLEYVLGPINEFLSDDYFRGLRVTELGPGHCDFLDIAKQRGAITFGADHDPTVCELGRLRGHEMLCAEFYPEWPYRGQVFDGIFSRMAFDIYCLSDQSHARTYLDDMAASLAPNGWMWIAPYNMIYPPSHGAYNANTDEIRAETDAWLKRSGIQWLTPDLEFQTRCWIQGYPLPITEIWWKARLQKDS